MGTDCAAASTADMLMLRRMVTATGCYVPNVIVTVRVTVRQMRMRMHEGCACPKAKKKSQRYSIPVCCHWWKTSLRIRYAAVRPLHGDVTTITMTKACGDQTGKWTPRLQSTTTKDSIAHAVSQNDGIPALTSAGSAWFLQRPQQWFLDLQTRTREAHIE